jgi:hypothetical protein
MLRICAMLVCKGFALNVSHARRDAAMILRKAPGLDGCDDGAKVVNFYYGIWVLG